MTTTRQDYGDWLGRTEVRSDILTPSAIARLLATLDRRPEDAAGTAMPPLSHWLCFLPDENQQDIGPDGHPKRGGFLPPVHELPRRMWAGSRLAFHGALPVGVPLERRSTIASIEDKQGGAGLLVFVTVRHEIAEPGGPVLVVDEHDIVYRGMGGPAAKPASPAGAPGVWHRMLVPDAVLLFRYSALTFNGHRIHYDRDYAKHEEGYPGLVVHGPLIATLLLDLVQRNRPRAAVATFAFRAMSPLFDGGELHLNGRPSSDGTVDLWAANRDGGLLMRAKVTLAEGG